MQTSSLSFILVVLSAISSVNYGFPHSSPRSSTVADVIEVSTNQDASVRLAHTSFTSATPTEETHTVAAKSTPHPIPSTSDSNDEATLAVGRINGDISHLDSTDNADDNAGKGGRPVADLTQGADNKADVHIIDKASTTEDGFPWWSLMLILLATVVIIIAIALPFVLYNRRLNKRRSIIKNSKRASEVIVDSWMAASHSSIPPPSSSTSSDSSNDYDVETSCDQNKAASNLGLITVEDANSRDNILGAEGGCENMI